MLERSVTNRGAKLRRLSRKAATVAALSLLVGTVLAALLLLRPHVDIVVLTPPPVAEPTCEPEPAPEPPIAIAAIEEAPVAELPGTCAQPAPPTDSDAGSPLRCEEHICGPTSAVARAAAPIQGVAASPTQSGLIAAWSSRALYLSRDDGRTFDEILSGPGTVWGAAIDCRGQVWAIRGKRLGRLGLDGAEVWRPLPARIDTGYWYEDAYSQSRPALAASANQVAVATSGADLSTLISVSDDDGDSWRFFTTEGLWGDLARDLRIGNDGAMMLANYWSDCSWEGVDLFRGSAESGLAPYDPEDPGIVEDAQFTHQGWMYSVYADCAPDSRDQLNPYSRLLCRRGPNVKEWKPTSITIPDSAFSLIQNGYRSVMLAGDNVYDLEGGRIELRAAGIGTPEYFTAQALDSSGRPLGVLDHHLVRWSPGHGWRVLLASRSQPLVTAGD